MLLSVDFAISTFTRYRKLGASAFDESNHQLRSSKRFRGFLVALAFATLCIFTRSVYRVAELSEGWSGKLIKTQRYFIGLEGAVVSAAVFALNIYHPGWTFRVDGQDGTWTRKRTRVGNEKATGSSDDDGEVVTAPSAVHQIGEN